MRTGHVSPHFFWEETWGTQVRTVDNTIPPELEENIVKTADRLELVRNILGVPVLVNSWYRCPALNRIVKGSRKSQHMRGEAVDFVAPAFGTPYQICREIQTKFGSIEFDQIILEHTWVHISFNHDPCRVSRRQILTLMRNKTLQPGLVPL